MCDDNGDPFISTFHSVLLEPDLCDKLFAIIKLINLGHTCLFYKEFYNVYFGAREKMQLHLQCTKKTCIFEKNKGNVKSKEIDISKENCFRIITSKIRS